MYEFNDRKMEWGLNESRLQVLRNKHRPAVEAALEERSKGLLMLKENKPGVKLSNGVLSRMSSESSNGDELYLGVSEDVEINSLPDLQEQVFSFSIRNSNVLLF